VKDILKIPQTLSGIILALKDIKGFVEYLGFDWNLASEAIKIGECMDIRYRYTASKDS